MKQKTINSLFAIVIVGIAFSRAGAIRGAADYHANMPEDYFNISDSSLISEAALHKRTKIVESVYITAYSSRPQETDDTPFITASGSHVRDGVVAANWLPFGTRIRIPALFGNKVFIVEDRMHRRNADKLDIWFASTKDAIHFGVKKTKVEIL